MQIKIFIAPKNGKIAFKHLNRADKRRVKKHNNLLNNPSFIASRLAKRQLRRYYKSGLAHKDCIVAFTKYKRGVGIDIEELKIRDFSHIMSFCFNENELDFYQNSSDKLMAFYKIFTAKEAIIKASGDGVSDIKSASFFDKRFHKTHILFNKYLITFIRRK